jgi:hypothetical protein
MLPRGFDPIRGDFLGALRKIRSHTCGHRLVKCGEFPSGFRSAADFAKGRQHRGPQQPHAPRERHDSGEAHGEDEKATHAGLFTRLRMSRQPVSPWLQQENRDR